MAENLNPDEILTAEFEHISQASWQNNEDRARVSTFYLVTVGTIIAALIGVQAAPGQEKLIYTAFAVLFLVLSMSGFLSLLQLVRYRLAWIDSVRALNKIKQYYMDKTNDEQLGQAFRWMEVPAGLRPWSIASLLAVQVAFLGGATFGAALVFTLLAQEQWQESLLAWPVGIGLLYAAVQLVVYVLVLRREKGGEV